MEHKYIKLVHSNPEHANWFVVNWCLGNTCNYSCSYCPPNLHNGSKPWPTLEEVKGFVTKVVEQTAPRQVYFEFTGGEVTLNKNFIEICKHCTSLGAKVGLISNGSRTLRWWKENKEYFDHVCLSFHPEFADPDHFMEVAKILKDDVRTHINIMMAPDKFDYCYELADKIKDIGNVSMALQPLIVDFGEKLYDYTNPQKAVMDRQHDLITKYIKNTKTYNYYRGAMRTVNEDGTGNVSSAHRFINSKTNDWSGWKCWAGVEQIIVDLGGAIWRGWCREGGCIGNISDSELKIPSDPVVCNKTMCHCNFDIMCTKEK